ncbi:hypothetical protein IWX65_002770 [Arthrobacter sp. CAN_A214]
MSSLYLYSDGSADVLRVTNFGTYTEDVPEPKVKNAQCKAVQFRGAGLRVCMDPLPANPIRAPADGIASTKIAGRIRFFEPLIVFHREPTSELAPYLGFMKSGVSRGVALGELEGRCWPDGS